MREEISNMNARFYNPERDKTVATRFPARFGCLSMLVSPSTVKAKLLYNDV